MLLAARLTASLILLGATLWGAGLIAFQLTGATAIAGALGFGLAGLAGITGLWTGAARLPLSFAVILLGLLSWWAGLDPSHARRWIPELDRLPAIERQGDSLTIRDLRDFRWRTEQDYDPRWTTRTVALSRIEGVDAFLSYWSGEAIAHLLISFAVRDEAPLTVSIEVRREQGEEWSALAGFFRRYEMAYVVAEERDIVALRTHARGEDVRLFRLAATPQQARDLLLAFAEDINRLAAEPRWYNTLTTNCTTVAYALVAKLAPDWAFAVPADPRVLLSGYLPGYFQRVGAVRSDVPLDELVRRGRITERARAVDPADPAFSARIREGVPSPR